MKSTTSRNKKPIGSGSITYHADVRWCERTNAYDITVRDGWDRGVPAQLHGDEAEVRYVSIGTMDPVVLLRRNDNVVTTLPASRTVEFSQGANTTLDCHVCGVRRVDADSTRPCAWCLSQSWVVVENE